tara:strand:- start:1319 stop:1441 length:123 start_codon:yes stop_codon:yes gene_type:complete
MAIEKLVDEASIDGVIRAYSVSLATKNGICFVPALSMMSW